MSAQGMKAVLLCAGEGTRLRPLTFTRPKHLMPVAGRPVLDHVLSSLAAAGISETVFVVGTHAPVLREFIGDGSRWGMPASFAIQPEPRGLADAVRSAREHVEGQRFIVYLGDDLLGDGVSEFVSDFAGSDVHASLIVKSVGDPRQFGVVVVEEGQVVRLVEKPQDPPSDLAIVGIYGFGPEIFEAIERTKPSARGELEITDAMEALLEGGGRVECHITEGFWADAGSPQLLLAANEFFVERGGRTIEGRVTGCAVEGAVQVCEGARVSSSRLIGPCLIGPGALVSDSVLGPNVSVGAGCEISGARIDRSILDEGCVIMGLTRGITQSLLGREVRISLPGTGGGPLALMLADNTQMCELGEE